MVERGRIELPTFRLSGECSNRLNYCSILGMARGIEPLFPGPSPGTLPLSYTIHKSEIEERITLFIILNCEDAGILPGRYLYNSLVLRDMVPQMGFEPMTPGLWTVRLDLNQHLFNQMVCSTTSNCLLTESPVLCQLSYWSISDGFTHHQ